VVRQATIGIRGIGASQLWVEGDAMLRSSAGRRAGRRNPRHWPLFALTLAPLIAGAMLVPSAVAGPALPTGGRVQAGAAVIGAPSGSALTINQSSSRAIIDWSSFSVGQAGSVQFNNGSGATLNRVTGQAGSTIDGLLAGTGSVYLINPSGVIVGKSGVVKVGGSFVASSQDLANGRFMAGGDLTFAGTSTAAVINFGKIGALGGDVALIASKVENHGEITAANGTAGLLAGYQVVLRDRALDDGKFAVALGGADTSSTNVGLIQAANAELRANGGNVYALAGNTGSVIKADGVAASDGKVFLVAEGGALTVRGEIDATRADGTGGQVETSGASVDFTGVKVRAANWLIDPPDLTVDLAAATTISDNLATTNVTLKTTATTATGPGVVNPNGVGDITIAAPISWFTPATLTIDAYHSVAINAPVKAGGAGKVVLTTNDGGTGGDYSFGPNASLRFTSNPGIGQALAINGRSYTLVYSVGGLLNINSGLGGAYALAVPIDMGGPTYGATPIADYAHTGAVFSGVFIGLGNTIANFRLNTSTSYGGLFGFVSGTIRDVGLTSNVVTASGGIVGGLAGWVQNGAVTNAYANGSVISGSGVAGGLVGLSYLSSISKSYAMGAVSGSSASGGLVGDLEASTLAQSYATTAVSGSSGQALGGLVGLANGSSITRSYATGPVNGAAGLSYVGGLVGYDLTTPVSWSYATGAVSAPNAFDVGGLVGLANAAISLSYATGAVSAPGATYVGGLAGSATGTISQSYATGTAGGAGASRVGGLIGGYSAGGGGGGQISQSYAAGAVSGNTNVGGFVGYLNSGTISSSFWDTQTSGTSVGIGVYQSGTGTPTGLTTAQMQNPASYSDSGWDFVNVWSPPSAGFYPQLYGVSHVLRITADNKTKIYGDPVPTLTSNLYGLQGGDTAAILVGGSPSTIATDTTSVGSYAITIDPASANGSSGAYRIIDQNGALGITPRPLTASLIGAVSKVYDTTTTASLAIGNYQLNGVLFQDQVSLNDPATGSYDTKDVGSLKLVSVGGLTLTGFHAGNYTVNTSASAKIGEITPAPLTASLTGTVSKVYDTTTTASLGPANYQLAGVLGSDVVTLNDPAAGAYDTKDVGLGKTVTVNGLALSGAGAGNYEVNVSASAAIGEITPAALTASLTGTVSKVYDTTTAASLAAGNYQLTGVLGSDVVTLNDPAAGTYDTKTVGSGKAVTVDGLALTGSDAGNYTVNTSADAAIGEITAASLTASLTGSVSKAYDATTIAGLAHGNYQLTGVLGSDVVALNDPATGTYDTKDAGSGKIVTVSGVALTGADAGNYSIASAILSGAVGRIDPKSLTASLTGMVQKTYDGTTDANLAASNYSVAGAISGDDIALNNPASGSYDTKNAGNGKTVTVSGVALTGVDAGNYSIASATLSGAVGQIDPKALTASFTGVVRKTYDGNTDAILAAGNYNLTGTISGDDIALNNPVSGSYDTRNAGSGKTVTVSGVALTGLDAGNYSIASGTLSGAVGQIDPKALTAALTGVVQKTYDGTTDATLAAANYDLSGVIAGDAVGLSDPTSGSYDTKNVGTSKVVTFSSLALSGADAGNYSLETSTLSGAVGRIDPKALTASLTGTVRKTYDGTILAMLAPANYSLAGTVSGDDIALNNPVTGAYDTPHAGAGKTVTVGGVALTGADAGNYSIGASTLSGAVGQIDPKTLTASLKGTVQKTYDATTTAALAGSNYGLTGVLVGDIVSLNNPTTGSYDSKNVGKSKLVTVSDLALIGASAGDYQLASNSLSAAIGRINAKALIASLVGTVVKSYDGTDIAYLTPANYALSGAIAGDVVGLNDPAIGSYNNKKVGTNKTVTVTGVALIGTDAGNYSIPSTKLSASIGTINPASTLFDNWAGLASAANRY
jgi:filamentous hemagglutinin family protein